MPIRNRWKHVAVAAGLVAGLAACESENALDTNLITADIYPDYFSFSVNGLDNVTGGVRYFWTLTDSLADIDVTQSVTSGTAIVQIRDGAGDVVYQEDARDAIDSTIVGAAGFWQVDVVLTKATGGFSVVGIRVDTTAVP